MEETSPQRGEDLKNSSIVERCLETSPQRGEDALFNEFWYASEETSPQRGEDSLPLSIMVIFFGNIPTTWGRHLTKIILYIKILEKTDFYNIMIYIQIFKELLYHSNLFVIN